MHPVWPTLTLAAILLMAAEARAQETGWLAAPDDASEPSELAVSTPESSPRLGPPSPIAVSAEAYGGLLSQWTGGDHRAHALGGGQLRVRYYYLQAGAFADGTDSGEAGALAEETLEHYRTLGGFVGAWLPFEDWVDVDAALGIGSRTYVNPISLYGPHGFRMTLTAFTFRLGVSSRSSAGLLGVRVGGGLVASLDAGDHRARWHRKYLRADGSEAETTGTIPIGGFSLGLVVGLGLELCACRTGSQ